MLFFWHIDRGMQMNNAMFTMNGHCGYVLKPEALRLGPGEVCNHDKAPSFVKTYPVDVTLEVSTFIYLRTYLRIFVELCKLLVLTRECVSLDTNRSSRRNSCQDPTRHSQEM